MSYEPGPGGFPYLPCGPNLGYLNRGDLVNVGAVSLTFGIPIVTFIASL